MKNNNEFNKSLRGYRVQDVDRYLSELDKKYQDELTALKKKLEDTFQEKNRLDEKLMHLQESIQVIPIKKEILTLAQLRLKNTLAVIHDRAGKESEEILAQTRNKTQDLVRKVQDINKDIRAKKSYLEVLIQNMMNILAENDPAKKSAFWSEKVVGKIIPTGEKLAEAMDKAAAPEQAAADENVEDVKKTADGTTLLRNSIGANIQEKMVRDTRKKGGFWDDEAPEEAFVAKPEQRERENRPEHNRIEAITEIKPAGESRIEQNRTYVESPALTSEINSIKHKYIVGKIAGEDLHDNAGNLIVTKNQVITEEIVNRAEKEGKLPELIVHMMIPGLEA